MNKESRDRDFQHLVLAGLWVLILCCWGRKPLNQATNFQSSAIAFGDLHGTEGENAKVYRRTITYGEFLN